jgi:hypothetical protein
MLADNVQHGLWHVGDVARDAFAQEKRGKVIGKVVAVVPP